jgi:hypothetical protein
MRNSTTLGATTDTRLFNTLRDLFRFLTLSAFALLAGSVAMHLFSDTGLAKLLAFMGAWVLVGVPLVRVGVCAIFFAVRRERWFALASAFALLVIVLGMAGVLRLKGASPLDKPPDADGVVLPAKAE